MLTLDLRTETVRSRSKSALCLALVLITMVFTSPAHTAEKSFFVGYNIGWFGPSFGLDLTSQFDLNRVQNTFESARRGGASVVRLWIFEAGQGLTLNKYAPQVAGVDPQLLANLRKVISVAREQHLKLYFTLLDGNTLKGLNQEQHDFFWNLMNNKFGEQDAFLANAVKPVLQLFSEHQDVIFGLDLINEIQGAIFGWEFSNWVRGPRDWIRRSAKFVKSQSPWLKITASSGWGSGSRDISEGYFTGLDLDFYDLHVYSNSGSIYDLEGVCQRAQLDGIPVILGEFGQSSHTDDDQLQLQATSAFLKTASQSCLSGALAWRFDSSEKWWNLLRDDGSFRPAVEIMKKYSSQKSGPQSNEEIRR